MLKSRRELLEKEIASLRNECAHMYYKAVTSGVEDPDYRTKLSRMYILKTDLEMVNQLIKEGYI